MSSTDPVKETHPDEIDLRDLFNRMGRTLSRWFRAIGRAIMHTTVFLIKNIIPIILSVIIGVGLSYSAKWIIKPVYVSEIIKGNLVNRGTMMPTLP